MNADRPRAYDLTQPAEVQRLIREVTGYMRTSLTHGTDQEGRRYAYEALRILPAIIAKEPGA